MWIGRNEFDSLRRYISYLEDRIKMLEEGPKMNLPIPNKAFCWRIESATHELVIQAILDHLKLSIVRVPEVAPKIILENKRRRKSGPHPARPPAMAADMLRS